VATKTPKSNKTSKTTATSKAAAKKTAAKKAAPARAPADAAPAPRRETGKETPRGTSKGTARGTGKETPKETARAKAAGKAATQAAGQATTQAVTKKTAARKSPAAAVATAAGKAPGSAREKATSQTTIKTTIKTSKASSPTPIKASSSTPIKATSPTTTKASGKAPGKSTTGAAASAASKAAGKKATSARQAPATQAARQPANEIHAPETATARSTAGRAAPGSPTQRKASRKAAAAGAPAPAAPPAALDRAAPAAQDAHAAHAAPVEIEAADRGSDTAPAHFHRDAEPQPTAEPTPGHVTEPDMEAEPATKSRMMDTTAKEGAPAEASAEAEGPGPNIEAEAGAATPAATPADDAAARTSAAVAAPEKRTVNVLRRPGGAKSGRPAKPSSRPAWQTYPEPLQHLVDVGRRMLGIDNLRPGQAEALTHVMNRRDLLAVMPTGSGKSLLYQLPSLVLDGLTVVVSPLIALIKDQIDKMVERGVPVCRFDSTITVKQRREYEALVQAPGGKLVFATPERISEPEFRDFLRTGAGGRGVALLVVDEAHCVSQWGHDFRPSYLTLRKVVEDLGRPQLLATTATAPPHVRDDILYQLGMPEAEIVTTTFERPNLHFEVIALPSDEDKLKTLVTLLKKLPRPGVVYCATVKKVEELYEALQRHAIPVAHYHGRLGKKDRDSEQQRLMEGKDLVMIATNAFGLGVDKANIRYVLHYHVPGSLEAYAQEAGRGGRDGKPARCVLLFSPDDVAIQEYFLTGTYPSRRQVRAVYKALSIWSPSEEAPPTITNLALSAHVGVQRTRTVLSLLKDEGFVVEREEGSFWLAENRPSEEVLHEKARQYEARRIADRQRLDALLAYVKTPRCRNQVILEYLGEPESPPCGRCDNCQRSREAALAAADAASRLEAKATAELDQEWSADSGGREEEEVKPRRLARHRVIRIDEPPASAAAPPNASGASEVPANGASAHGNGAPAHGNGTAARGNGTTARGNGVGHEHAAAAADERPARRPANGQMRLPLAEREVAALEDDAPAVALEAPATHEPALAVAGAMPAAAERLPAVGEEDEDFEDEDEDFEDEDGEEYEDEDEEYEDDEEGEDEDDEEYEDEEGEGEEGEDDEEYEDDDEEYEDDEDDEEYEDDEDEDDDEEYDDEDFELIEKTAAALAEEGYESDTEITILARKRVEKPRPPQKGAAAAQEAESEEERAKRRRKRKRRRKKRSMLPPKSAFITPVLSKSDDVPMGPSRGRRRRAGPVIEYVRGPMRINMTPVASATPNDVAPNNKKKKRRRRGEPGYPGSGVGAEGATVVVLQDPGAGRKRRRRRRRKRGAGTRPGTQEGPVSFFSTQTKWTPSAEPARDEPGRRRRRRKRRGRNGRQGREEGRSETQPAPRPVPPPSGE
jgi:ATP-dependent DNA helicase RecQ